MPPSKKKRLTKSRTNQPAGKSKTVKKAWNVKKSLQENLAAVGLVPIPSPRMMIRCHGTRAVRMVGLEETETVEVTSIPRNHPVQELQKDATGDKSSSGAGTGKLMTDEPMSTDPLNYDKETPALIIS